MQFYSKHKRNSGKRNVNKYAQIYSEKDNGSELSPSKVEPTHGVFRVASSTAMKRNSYFYFALPQSKIKVGKLNLILPTFAQLLRSLLPSISRVVTSALIEGGALMHHYVTRYSNHSISSFFYYLLLALLVSISRVVTVAHILYAEI